MCNANEKLDMLYKRITSDVSVVKYWTSWSLSFSCENPQNRKEIAYHDEMGCQFYDGLVYV